MAEWWRSAVFYEIYVRSFADANGDGLGDLPGIRSRLPYLAELGVDAIWLTPFYPTPDADHGYDVADFVDVDPRFGTLADFDELVSDAHALALRVVVDIVPNHTSDRHEWFRNALSSPDHPDRARYVFAPSRNGGPPNNWPSTFGGPAWTRDERSGDYYLHLFAPEQPDLDWHDEAVQEDFEAILRFWLDRGVDGFRIDVAHGLFKDAQLRDEREPFPLAVYSSDWRRSIDQPEVHPLYRRWRRLVGEYDGERILVGEVVFSDPARIAAYVREDELHLAFNFAFLLESWDAESLRESIDRTLDALAPVGATATWVLENHDVTRLATRFGPAAARAASLLLLALPGAVFVYAGQELGLEEVELPDELRRDPIFFRTAGARKGRDGCRVPMPWERAQPNFGFTSGTPWLPVPDAWSDRAVDAQSSNPSSSLSLYRRAIAARRASGALRHGSFEWRESPAGSLVFARSDADETVVCAIDVDAESLPLPAGETLVATDGAVWIRETKESPT